MRCAVTGANGYVGSRIVAAMRRAGWDVVEMSRRPEPGGLPFDLDRCFESGAVRASGVHALVHCAWDFTPRRWDDVLRTNVHGSIRLATAARDEGVERIVLISSMSAFDGARSLYGRAKRLVEHEVLSTGGVVVRPGLVWGPSAGGMYGAMERAIRRSRIVPIVGENRRFFLTHEDDLCTAVMRCADPAQEIPAVPIAAVHDQAIALRDIARRLARRTRRHVAFVPIPAGLARQLLRGAEAVGVRSRLRSDAVLSIATPEPAPDTDAAFRLGLRFRPFE